MAYVSVGASAGAGIEKRMNHCLNVIGCYLLPEV